VGENTEIRYDVREGAWWFFFFTFLAVGFGASIGTVTHHLLQRNPPPDAGPVCFGFFLVLLFAYLTWWAARKAMRYGRFCWHRGPVFVLSHQALLDRRRRPVLEINWRDIHSLRVHTDGSGDLLTTAVIEVELVAGKRPSSITLDVLNLDRAPSRFSS
jgi:hypothetical protein